MKCEICHDEIPADHGGNLCIVCERDAYDAHLEMTAEEVMAE